MSERTDRIVKNTFMLYVRSIIIMFLAIYTSRVLLSTLGVEDFGVYNVVGGIVAMFSSIKNVLAAAVQRFINYEKGQGNNDKVNCIFNSSLLIHIVLTVVFIILIEPIGMWYIDNHLTLPTGSIDNAIFVFHCSVAVTAFTIITIPFDAVVIANERMEFYAWMSIAEAVFKLLIIYILPVLPYQYLKSYAVLILLITLIHRLITILYCKRFSEARFQKCFNSSLIKEIGVFAGWNFFGCTASSLIEEGSNLILNAFGGVVANAARGVAYQVKSAVTSITSNIVIASQPFITQQSATVELSRFYSYIHLQSRFVFYSVALIAMPIYIYAPEILDLWLVKVPDNGPEFVRVVLLYVVILSFQKPIDLAFKSFGKIAKYQVIDTCILILSLPVVYIILRLGFPMHYSFYGLILVKIIDYVCVIILAKKEIGLNIKSYLQEVVMPSIKALFLIIIWATLFLIICKANSIFLLLLWVVTVFLLSSISIYWLVLNKVEKTLVKNMLNKILKRKKC